MEEKIIVRVLALQRRARCSANGNPRYRVTTDHGTYDTETDAACNYGITNDWGAKTSRLAQITLHRGKIIHITYLDDYTSMLGALRGVLYLDEIQLTPRSVLVQAHMTLGDIESNVLYMLSNSMVVRCQDGGACVRAPDSDEPVAAAVRAMLATALWNSDDTRTVALAGEQRAHPVRITAAGITAMGALSWYLGSRACDDRGA